MDDEPKKDLPPQTWFVEARLEVKAGLRATERHFGDRPCEIVGDRWVQVGHGLPGRPPVDPTLVREMQAALIEHWRDQQEKPKQDAGVELVKGWLEDRARHMGDSTILREVVAPVHQQLWPQLLRRGGASF
jgi:hypothetical protein